MKATLTALLTLLALTTLPTLAQNEAATSELVEAIPLPAEPTPVEPAEENADQPADTPDDDAPTPTPAEKTEPGVLRFHLMDGTVITGKLNTQSIPVSTEFGDLVVPIDAITNFSPGLDSHPAINQTITKLIEQLGNPEAKTRDKAQAQLLTYGPGLVPVLQEYADDKDAERKVRIATITEELMGIETDEFGLDQGPTVSLARLDHIVTPQFTIAGNIKQDTFSITSKFGQLTVKLADIKQVQRITTDKPEMRKVVQVAGSDMTCGRYKNTGIRVNRGDRIIISADGRITMSPWGSNSVSGPDGIPQNGMYNGKIPMGALAGKIGDNGEEFLVGSKNTFVAKSSGTLQLGFAMQQNWSNYQFPGEYKARIRVVPAE